MFGTSPIAHYRQIGTEGGVFDATPHRLVLFLMEGALVAISIAKIKLAEGKTEERGRAISKAIALIDEGLRASLDLEQGGAIAANLDSLYEYMSRQLFIANLKCAPELLDEVHHLLGEIKQSWEEIEPNAQQAMESARAENHAA